MSDVMIIIFSLIGLIIGFGISYFAGNKINAAKFKDGEIRVSNLFEKEASNLKKEKLIEVKEEWHKRKQDFENDAQQKRQKMQAIEKQLKSREENIESKIEQFNKKEKQVAIQEDELKTKLDNIANKEKEIVKIIEIQTDKLQQISGLSREDAKKLMMENVINDAKTESAHLTKRIIEEAKSNATKQAKSIILQAIQRSASDHSVESTVSVVSLDSDEMKGRIIGREGRNIRAFEAATGIDLIIDDTPEAVVISGFDPFRREVAKSSLEKLMIDGRIHPARIEEIVDKTRKELEEEIIHIGENACLQLGIHNMHNELLKIVGKMKYRSSYGQNLLNHSIEVAYLCGIMAAELGFDPILLNVPACSTMLGSVLTKILKDLTPYSVSILLKSIKNHIQFAMLLAHTTKT